MHHMITDTPFKFAREKAYEFLKDGRDVLVLVPNDLCRTYFKSDYISCKPVGHEDEQGIKSVMFVRSATNEASLRSVVISRLIMIGDLPLRAKQLVCERTRGFLSPDIWHVQSYAKNLLDTHLSLSYAGDIEMLCRLHGIPHHEILCSIACRAYARREDLEPWLLAVKQNNPTPFMRPSGDHINGS